MIWFVLAGICFIFFCVGLWLRSADWQITSVVVAVGLLFVGLLFSLFVGMSGSYNSYTKVKTQNLVALKDNSSVHGDFFLGIGTVDEEIKYSFYYEEEPGVYMLKTLDADYVQIAYSEGQNPRLETRYDCSRPGAWLMPGFDGCDESYPDYRLVIPNGSIKSNFVLDAE